METPIGTAVCKKVVFLMARAFLILDAEMFGMLAVVGTATGVAIGLPRVLARESTTRINEFPYFGSFAPKPAVIRFPDSSGSHASSAAATIVFPGAGGNTVTLSEDRESKNKCQTACE